MVLNHYKKREGQLSTLFQGSAACHYYLSSFISSYSLQSYNLQNCSIPTNPEKC
ncbi:hypothetical protein LINPERPRIM_LOCUS34095 [Linum perenne]